MGPSANGSCQVETGFAKWQTELGNDGWNSLFLE